MAGRLQAHVVAAAMVLGLWTPVAAQEAAPRLVAPVRGPAKVEITRPTTKRSATEMVTTILLKNTESAPIAGLRVDENWYDKQGNPVGGDVYRHRKPIQPGEVITITLRMPRNANLSRNQCVFRHANGTIQQTVVPKLEAPAMARQ